MTDRCAESWRLWQEVEKQDQAATAAGYPNSDFYKPFELAFREYQSHFKNCPQCRSWVDEWESGAKNEILTQG